MKEKPAPVTNFELNEIRTLIVERSGILFDASRERDFSTRVSDYVIEKNLHGGTELLRVVLGNNIEYDSMLESLLT
jgi:hypothetical protein